MYNRTTGTVAAAASVENALSDETLVARARAKDTTAFELLMRRHNQRIYRVVRSVLREPGEIEDVMQQAYLSAFVHLEQFQGASRWSTWVCRIAINEALARIKQRGRFESLDATGEAGATELWKRRETDPERTALDREFQLVVEQMIDRLPEVSRTVLIMREIEGMTTAETAAVLDVAEDVVKTRLHRARTSLRALIEGRVGKQIEDAFTFGNERCDCVVAGVLARLILSE